MGTMIAGDISSLATSHLAGDAAVKTAADSAASGIQQAANQVARSIQQRAGVAQPSGSSPSFPMSSNSTYNSTSKYDKLCTPQGRTHDYSCNIVTERMSLGGSYTIYVFFGPAPASPASWPFASNLVGSQSIFSSSDMPRRSGFLVSGSVALNNALVGQLQAGNLPSLEDTAVTAFLKTNMNWVVRTSKGQVIPNNEVPGLAVSVASSKIMPAVQGVLNSSPTYGQVSLKNQVTHGKPGGLSQGMPHDFWSVCKPIS